MFALDFGVCLSWSRSRIPGTRCVRSQVMAAVEHIFADRAGDWRVSILGSQENDRWEMKVTGPKAFERSYSLEGSAGEHRAEVVRVILSRMLPK